MDISQNPNNQEKELTIKELYLKLSNHYWKTGKCKEYELRPFEQILKILPDDDYDTIHTVAGWWEDSVIYRNSPEYAYMYYIRREES